MSECYKKYDQAKGNEAEANAAAFAYNSNVNVLYVPETTTDLVGANGEGRNGNKERGDEAFRELFKNIWNNDKEYKVISKATGKAKIENVNLNLIIRC